MTALKTVEYKSKAEPGKTYELPEESVKNSDHIMKYILKSKGADELVNLVNNHYYFGNLNLFPRSDLVSTARKIVLTGKGTKESLMFQDEFYIKTGLYEVCRVREKVKEMNDSLTEALNDLEGTLGSGK
jgi:hypothetical protein